MLIGSKICLAPMFQADAPIIFNWRNCADIMRSDGLYRPTSQSAFEEWFASIGRDSTKVVFSIRRQGDLAFLGYIQIVNIHASNRSAELGIMIGESANRQRGYGQEALTLCVGFCWSELNLQRLSMIVFGDNPAALRAYHKAGFEIEGIMRRAIYINGAYQDATMLALLRPV